MASNRGAVDHVLPVVGEPEFDQGFEQGIPHALLGPAPKADIDRDPFAVALVHVPPRAADAQHMKHAVQESDDCRGTVGSPGLARWGAMPR